MRRNNMRKIIWVQPETHHRLKIEKAECNYLSYDELMLAFLEKKQKRKNETGFKI